MHAYVLCTTPLVITYACHTAYYVPSCEGSSENLLRAQTSDKMVLTAFGGVVKVVANMNLDLIVSMYFSLASTILSGMCLRCATICIATYKCQYVAGDAIPNYGHFTVCGLCLCTTNTHRLGFGSHSLSLLLQCSVDSQNLVLCF